MTRSRVKSSWLHD